MSIESSDYGHFVQIEHAQTGEVFHFVVGKTKALRYLGGRTPDGATPSQSSQAYAAAEQVAADHFRAEGHL